MTDRGEALPACPPGSEAAPPVEGTGFPPWSEDFEAPPAPAAEVAAPAPPEAANVGDTDFPPGPAVSPEEAEVEASPVEAVLADFRAWLADAIRAEAPGAPAAPAPAPIDLHVLLGHFVGLRQEVNLQTRATRTQQEQNEKTLVRLDQALEVLSQAQLRAQQQQQQSKEEALRPVLTTLVELHDALALAGREVQRVRDGVLPLLDDVVAPFEEEPPEPREAAAPPLPVPGGAPARRSLWGRLFGSAQPSNGAPPAEVQAATERLNAAAGALESAAQRLREAGRRRELEAGEERAEEVQRACDRVGQALASLVTGYTMSLQRVERALRQHGLEAIPTLGEAYDPEHMEALEAVSDSDRPSGEVVQEVRRGYFWNGRVFRYAQVRVARG